MEMWLYLNQKTKVWLSDRQTDWVTDRTIPREASAPKNTKKKWRCDYILIKKQMCDSQTDRQTDRQTEWLTGPFLERLAPLKTLTFRIFSSSKPYWTQILQTVLISFDLFLQIIKIDLCIIGTKVLNWRLPNRMKEVIDQHFPVHNSFLTRIYSPKVKIGTFRYPSTLKLCSYKF